MCAKALIEAQSGDEGVPAAPACARVPSCCAVHITVGLLMNDDDGASFVHGGKEGGHACLLVGRYVLRATRAVACG